MEILVFLNICKNRAKLNCGVPLYVGIYVLYVWWGTFIYVTMLFRKLEHCLWQNIIKIKIVDVAISLWKEKLIEQCLDFI